MKNDDDDIAFSLNDSSVWLVESAFRGLPVAGLYDAAAAIVENVFKHIIDVENPQTRSVTDEEAETGLPRLRMLAMQLLGDYDGDELPRWLSLWRTDPARVHEMLTEFVAIRRRIHCDSDKDEWSDDDWREASNAAMETIRPELWRDV